VIQHMPGHQHDQEEFDCDRTLVLENGNWVFPRSPLTFRTAGFPRYGCKAGLSDGAFPAVAPLKSAPDMHIATTGLHPPFVHFVVPSHDPY
jgi:hypothetical protein